MSLSLMQVMLSLLKATYPVFLRHGFKPRAGYDLFTEDQLIWLVALTSGTTKLGTSVSGIDVGHSCKAVICITSSTQCCHRPQRSCS
jgi:hypothetical protein